MDIFSNCDEFRYHELFDLLVATSVFDFFTSVDVICYIEDRGDKNHIKYLLYLLFIEICVNAIHCYYKSTDELFSKNAKNIVRLHGWWWLTVFNQLTKIKRHKLKRVSNKIIMTIVEAAVTHCEHWACVYIFRYFIIYFFVGKLRKENNFVRKVLA